TGKPTCPCSPTWLTGPLACASPVLYRDNIRLPPSSSPSLSPRPISRVLRGSLPIRPIPQKPLCRPSLGPLPRPANHPRSKGSFFQLNRSPSACERVEGFFLPFWQF